MVERIDLSGISRQEFLSQPPETRDWLILLAVQKLAENQAGMEKKFVSRAQAATAAIFASGIFVGSGFIAYKDLISLIKKLGGL
jgi:hypothetical protein